MHFASAGVEKWHSRKFVKDKDMSTRGAGENTADRGLRLPPMTQERSREELETAQELIRYQQADRPRIDSSKTSIAAITEPPASEQRASEGPSASPAREQRRTTPLRQPQSSGGSDATPAASDVTRNTSTPIAGQVCRSVTRCAIQKN